MLVLLVAINNCYHQCNGAGREAGAHILWPTTAFAAQHPGLHDGKHSRRQRRGPDLRPTAPEVHTRPAESWAAWQLSVGTQT